MPKPWSDLSVPLFEGTESAARTVVVFGELLADVFPDRRVVGGAPFNVACHLQGFGFTPLLATRVGQDAAASFLLEAVQRSGLDASLIQFDSERASGRVDVIADGDGHRFEIPADQAFDFIESTELADSLARHVAGNDQPRLIYFGTLAQRNSVSRNALGALLELFPAPRFVDLNLRPPWVSREVCERSLLHAAIVKLSEDELRVVAGWANTSAGDSSTVALGKSVAKHFGIGSLFVTCGARGAWCVSDGEVTEAPAVQAATANGDTVGAGDAFSATVIAGAIAGWTLSLTLERAGRFATRVCGIRGATPVDPGFYEPFREEWSG